MFSDFENNVFALRNNYYNNLFAKPFEQPGVVDLQRNSGCRSEGTLRLIKHIITRQLRIAKIRAGQLLSQ